MKPVVVSSINACGDARCVDIFRRTDGTFGFEEYRRDPEDARGWYAIGYFGAQSFVSFATALAAARSRIAWFADVTP